MRMVELTRQDGDGTAAVVLAVGPLEDAAADDYADRLHRLLEHRTGHGLTARTTPVDSVSGDTADPPADPEDLLNAVLAEGGIGGAAAGEHELPPSGGA
jgi:hypothetical protein